MQVYATRKDAHDLMLDAAMTLSKISGNGIRMDVPYMKHAQRQIGKQIQRELAEFETLDDVKLWKKKYGAEYNPGSNQQLGDILFNELGYEGKKKTKAGADAVDVNVLEELLEESDNPMLKSLMHIRKLQKASGTYIDGLLRETTDGYLHPSFPVCFARSYRSASRNPNFQNIPTRDKEIKKLVRTAFIPREGRQILELDFKGIEVSTAYMYHLDPTMKAYLLDPTKDMHRDMAMQLYKLGPDEWNKPCRQGAKNKFVFPEFYGSYWKNVGTDLWKYAALNKLRVGKDEKGPTIFEHLASHGIPSLPKFLKHVEKIEDHFWHERFPVYTQWKQDWIDAYQKRGYFDSYTGFRYTGILKRNEIINYAIQGSASHCLLWTMCQLQRWLERKGFKSLIIGQIHDSMVIDVVPSELDALLTQVQILVRKKLPARYEWITIPLTIEAEIAPIDHPWLDKAEIDIKSYLPA